ncbi:MAG: molybdenum cofactor biosynthesis protein [Pirellulaceae bacterium]|nr:MAG: molybdenum cofactor biosynthesis protein [Pirellulaceae bacterium]
MVRVRELYVYPIKSLDGVSVASARILPGGALEGDRRYALFDSQGRFVNGKRTPRITRLRTSYERNFRRVIIRSELDQVEGCFDIDEEADELARFLGDFLGEPVRLAERRDGGFPDDLEASGPTVVSLGSLEVVAGWFAPLSADDVRQRMRPNVVLEDCPPFWEDRLGSEGGVPFRIGSVSFLGMRICRRCVVPTLEPGTAERWPGFERHFMERRWGERPAWSPLRDRIDSYRFAINTRGLSTGVVHVGDPVTLS